MGLFDIINEAAGAMSDMARRSDDPEMAKKYIDLFNNRVETGSINELEEMLQNNRYKVKIDSKNDYKREAEIRKRLQELYKKRDKQVEGDRKEFEDWLSKAGLEKLEKGLSEGKYKIDNDEKENQSRLKRIEKKLRPLQEARKQKIEEENCIRMEQLFREYLKRTEEDIYKSYYVYSDFRREMDHLAGFQKRVLQDIYGEAICTLVSKQIDELKEILSDYVWQINKKKLIAGKSLITLMLSEKKADGEKKTIISEYLSSIDEIVFRNAYMQYISDSELNLSPKEYLEIGNRSFLEGKPAKAVASYFLSAKNGNIDAVVRLGMTFLYGLGVEKSEEKAFDLFTEAAMKKSPEGIYGLGICYLYGFGIQSSYQKAVILLKRSVSIGCSEALHGLGCCYEKDREEKNNTEAFKWNLRAAKRGCILGMIRTYQNYSIGDGVDQNVDIAHQWREKILELLDNLDSNFDLTYFNAFFYLGSLYASGWNSSTYIDNENASEWYMKGIAIGDMRCKQGVIELDSSDNSSLLLELEKVNYNWSFKKLAECYKSGSGKISKDEVKSRYYELKAAKNGEAESQYSIGLAYLDGSNGIEKDINEAMDWLELAETQGVLKAKDKLKEYESVIKKEKEKRRNIEFQERASSELQQVSSIKKQISELNDELRRCEDRIDNAASEKEESIAIADKEKVEKKLNSLYEMSEELDKKIAQIKNELDSPKKDDVVVSRESIYKDPYDDIIGLFDSDNYKQEEDCVGESRFECVCPVCEEKIILKKRDINERKANCPYCGDILVLNIASNKEELKALVNNGVETIYICGKSMSIPTGINNTTFVGVNNPIVDISESCDYTQNTYYGVELSVSTCKILAGSTQNDEEAFAWWNKAAEQGDMEAQFELAQCYDNGLGVEINDETAFKWYKLSADQGFPKAEYRLGQAYKGENNDAADHYVAAKWIKKAAEHGLPEAQYDIGLMYESGLGVDQSYEEANKWFLKAAEQDYDLAQINLAENYGSGDGIEQSEEKAIFWLQKAAKLGNCDAIVALIEEVSPDLVDLPDVLSYSIGGIENLRTDCISFEKNYDNNGKWISTDVSISVWNREEVRVDILQARGIVANIETDLEYKAVKTNIFSGGIFSGFKKALSDEYFYNEFDHEYYKYGYYDSGWGTIKMKEINVEVLQGVQEAFLDQTDDDDFFTETGADQKSDADDFFTETGADQESDVDDLV